MNLQEQIKKDMVRAMKNRNEIARDILRVLMAELDRNFVKEDVEVVKIVKKLIENIKENGDDEGEIEVLEKYLPQQMTESQMITLVKEVINNENITSISGLGTIMAYFKNKHAGTYDGRVLSTIVKNELS